MKTFNLDLWFIIKTANKYLSNQIIRIDQTIVLLGANGQTDKLAIILAIVEHISPEIIEECL